MINGDGGAICYFDCLSQCEIIAQLVKGMSDSLWLHGGEATTSDWHI